MTEKDDGLEVKPKTKKADALTLAKENLFQRQRAYISTFGLTSEMGNVVLADLAKFCRATESTFDPDPRLHALLEGRREVFLRIANHINLSSGDLLELVTQGRISKKES